MNPFVSNGNKLRWRFENVKDLDEIGILSDVFIIGPTKWKIEVLTKMTKDVKYLAIFLYYAGDNENEEQWICQVDSTMKLICQNENGNDVSKTILIKYSNNSNHFGWPQFYKWDDLDNNGYMKNDSIIIEVDFNLKYYDFSKNIPNLTDVSFKVEDTEFYTNKGILCIQSEYFYDLFINKNHDKQVIEIKDIELNEFRLFLASFYSFFDGVEYTNYEKLIELAEKYKVVTLHTNCENYLMKNTGMPVEKKLEYADKYDYYDLMKQSINSLNNARRIKNICKSYEFYKFKDSTKRMILLRVLDFVSLHGSWAGREHL
ncbi:unnamed protein product [Caenorhabditis angaria]|uniref:BTB domain-containing protein n=1 Tax=Caenorhabditis angaria TaxID=860376 RepID=A0A9P1IBL9_9PELO|nr:unnamed protein product [Caenorhabditis angaria]